MYNSIETSKLYQEKPRTIQPYAPGGWTKSIPDYLHEAKKLSLLIKENKAVHTWFATIHLSKVLEPKEIKAFWTKAKRNLRRKGVVGVWTIEVTKSNKVHWHILISSAHTRTDLEKIIETSLPDRKTIPWRKRLIVCDGRPFLPWYITKAKIKGTIKGKPTNDKYRAKRLLFVANSGLTKHGTIGDYWRESPKAIWGRIKHRESLIAMSKPDVQRLTDTVFEWLGYSLNRATIERSYALHYAKPQIMAWAAEIDVLSND